MKQPPVEEKPVTKLLIKCPKCTMENYSMMVTSGICSNCGYNGNKDKDFKGQ